MNNENNAKDYFLRLEPQQIEQLQEQKKKKKIDDGNIFFAPFLVFSLISLGFF